MLTAQLWVMLQLADVLPVKPNTVVQCQNPMPPLYEYDAELDGFVTPLQVIDVSQLLPGSDEKPDTINIEVFAPGQTKTSTS
jgi:hypothetical protein